MPEKIINVHAAKTHLSRLLDEVQAGQEIVLAKAGKPYARLVPYAPRERELGFVTDFKLPDSFLSRCLRQNFCTGRLRSYERRLFAGYPYAALVPE